MRLLHYLDDCLVIAESWDLLLQHRELVLQLCKDLGIIVNWEMSDLQPSTHVQYLGMLMDTSLEKVFLSQVCLACFWGAATLHLVSVAPSAHVAAVVGSHSFVGTLSFSGSHSHTSSTVAPQRPLVPHGGQADRSDPMSQECVEAVRWWLQEDRWLFGVPLQFPPPSLLLYTDASLSGRGVYLLDLTASGVWSEEESLKHIQCAGNEGSVADSDCLPASAVGAECRHD